MAKLRINGDSSGYVDLEAPNAASSSTLDLDQLPQKNVANTFTANNTFSSNSYFGSEGVRLSTDGSGELGVGYGQTATTKRFSVYNGTSNRFSISPEGYVTTPSQPSFIAKANSTFNYTGGTGYVTIANLGDVILNRSNSYNGSTGTFTAPVTGHYQFNFQLLLSNVATGDDSIHIGFYQNGSLQIFANLRSPGSAANGVVGYGQYLPVIGVGDMYMSANDTLQIKLSSSGTMNIYAGGDWGRFSGHLIG